MKEPNYIGNYILMILGILVIIGGIVFIIAGFITSTLYPIEVRITYFLPFISFGIVLIVCGILITLLMMSLDLSKLEDDDDDDDD